MLLLNEDMTNLLYRLLSGSGGSSSEPTNDEFTSKEDDAVSVFGGIQNVKFQNLICTFIVVIGVIITLEYIFDKMHEAASDAGQIKLFNKMQRELVMMGLISFGVFIVESAVEIDPMVIGSFRLRLSILLLFSWVLLSYFKHCF